MSILGIFLCDQQMKIKKKNKSKSKRSLRSIFLLRSKSKQTANKKSINKNSKIYSPGKTIGTKDNTTKVFKPKQGLLIKEKVKRNTLNKFGIKKRKAHNFGFAPYSNIKKINGIKNIPKKIKLFIKKHHILERFNFFVALIAILSIIGWVVYLSFFDTKFMIKKYTITFTENSYVNEHNITEIINEIKSDKWLRIIPNNQLWFINEKNITKAAQNVYPEIISVDIKNRQWPNEVKLEITTEPILITLGINENEYWRIAKNGNILGKDNANIRDNLVIVEQPVTIVHTSGFGQDFGQYSFENQSAQKEKFWFILQLWQWLDKYNIDHIKTSIPSLSDFDTNVTIWTANGTRLIFDINTTDKSKQESRIETIFDKTIIGVKERSGGISYIDFRIPKKVYWCYKDTKCDIK